MERLAGAFWKLSIGVFTIVFMYIYAYLGTRVGLNYNEYGQITSTISKDEYFYYGIALFLVLNMVLWTIGKLFLKNKLGEDDWLLDFKGQVRAWLIGFAGVINIFFLTVLAYILFVNNEDGIIAHKYGGIVYVGLIFIVLWMALLFVLLVKKVKTYSS